MTSIAPSSGASTGTPSMSTLSPGLNVRPLRNWILQQLVKLSMEMDGDIGIPGVPTTGKSSFGTALVAGRKRVPQPAAGKTAFRTRIEPRHGQRRRSPYDKRCGGEPADRHGPESQGQCHRGEDRPLGREVLEHLGRENASAPAPRVGDEEQERLRVALKGECLAMRQVREELNARVEAERFRKGAVGWTEIADETGDDLLGRAGKRSEERLRVPAAEEVTGVRDPQPLARRVSEAREIVEVAPVPDHLEARRGNERTHLLGDCPRRADDAVGVAAHEAGEPPLPADVVPPVRVRGEGVA